MKCFNWQRKLAVFLLLALCFGLTPGGDRVARADPPPQGNLTTASGPSIGETELVGMLNQYIPDTNAKNTLVILTECYGGNMTDSFAGRANTTVLSATSEGQKATYGGYDDDAAKALSPGAGRTSDDVHNAGTAGKAPGETPTKGGTLSSVSLEPATATGTIKSRHILIYAGKPDPAAGRDVEQRDKIIDNFKNQPPPTTTITTVGGPADNTNGWKYAGTKAGMTKALAEIQAVMGPDEQFVLFVTDHGGQQSVATPTCQNNKCDVDALTLPETALMDMLGSPPIEPVVTLFTPYDAGAPMLEPFNLKVCKMGTSECNLFENQMLVLCDLNEDLDWSDPGEGYYYETPPLPPHWFSPPSGGVDLTATGGVGYPPGAFALQQMSLNSGGIAKGIFFKIFLPTISR